MTAFIITMTQHMYSGQFIFDRMRHNNSLSVKKVFKNQAVLLLLFLRQIRFLGSTGENHQLR
jgi:hypothetical protein